MDTRLAHKTERNTDKPSLRKAKTGDPPRSLDTVVRTSFWYVHLFLLPASVSVSPLFSVGDVLALTRKEELCLPGGHRLTFSLSNIKGLTEELIAPSWVTCLPYTGDYGSNSGGDKTMASHGGISSSWVERTWRRTENKTESQ